MFEDERVDAENVGSDPVARADALHVAVGHVQRELLSVLAEIDHAGAWEGDGARDMPHWVSMRYGVSAWKATRWIAAAHALAVLPLTAAALVTGRLPLDKVVELTRFATAETEASLIRWAGSRLVRRDPPQGRPRAEARTCRDRRGRTHPFPPLVVRGRGHPVRAGGRASRRSGCARRQGHEPPGRLDAGDAGGGRA